MLKVLSMVILALPVMPSVAIADRHCQVPERPTPPYDLLHVQKGLVGYQQAYDLTYRALLEDRNIRNAEICEADPEGFHYNCDAVPFPTFDEVNPDFLGLTEEEYEVKLDAQRLAGLEALERFSACCLLYTSPSPRDKRQSRMPSSA